MKSQDVPASCNKTPKHAKGSAGFSLVEVLIVLALIGLLAGLAVTNLNKIMAGGKESAAKIFVTSSLETPIQSYMLHVGSYPTKLDDLKTNPGKGNKWKGPYTDKELVDPWGNKYEYRAPAQKNTGGSYDLWSKGADQQSGTQDDIGNWQN